ncbi:MAG: PadR family transcriptional regulator [Acidobacteriota bacterium]
MPTVRPDPTQLLPLKPDVFTILLVLLDGERHGYGIMKEASKRGGRSGQLQPGALYRLLKQMLEGELVEELDRRKVPDNSDERRRYYCITPFGRRVAAAEAQRMAELVAASRERDLLEEGRLP